MYSDCCKILWKINRCFMVVLNVLRASELVSVLPQWAAYVDLTNAGKASEQHLYQLTVYCVFHSC